MEKTSKKSCAVRHLDLQTTEEESIAAIRKQDKKTDCVVRFERRWMLCRLGHQSDHHSCRKRENSNSNSKTLFYNDCSLGSVKNLWGVKKKEKRQLKTTTTTTTTKNRKGPWLCV